MGKSPIEKHFNTLRPRQNRYHFADGIFKSIFVNENIWIFIKISLKFIPKGPINHIPALVQVMVWHQPGNKALQGSPSKSSLALIQEFWNSSICLYEIKKKNLSKSTCPTGSFTCPRQWEMASPHYLDQRWLDHSLIYASLSLNELRN